MLDLYDIIINAFKIMFGAEEYYFTIVLTSLYVSVTATIVASLIFIPLSALIVVNNFFLKKFLQVVINSLLALPPVVIGLFLYILFSRIGVFGDLDLLYTSSIMIIAQVILIIPIIMTLAINNINNIYYKYREYLISIHSDKISTMLTIIWESRRDIVVGTLVAFGRVLSEVGAIIIVGGNIENLTRTMTTGIVLETSKESYL